VIATGLGLLRLAPRDFWTMTPVELGHVVRALGGSPAAPPQRQALQTLMAMFPDTIERQVE